MNMGQITQASEKNPEPKAIREVTNIGYYEGTGKDPAKHKLDLFLPPNPENAPVFFFVHGGAWVQGDKNFFGIYPDRRSLCFRRSKSVRDGGK